MSHDMKTGELTFNCDTAGCHANYSAGNTSFKETWAEAKAHGWRNYLDYPRGVSTWVTVCPQCAKRLGD